MMTSSNKESSDNDQHSYFYVVWPEESKSPRVCTSASNAAVVSTFTSSAASVLTSDAAASSAAALDTSVPMSTSQPAFEYDREDSRHTSSCSSVQSKSPDQSPVPVLQLNLPVSSTQSKVPAVLDEVPKISSNGVRGPQPNSVSLSPAGGVVATTTTYMIPSISSTHVRHTKTVVLPSDPSLTRGNYAREPEAADSNLKEIANLARQAIAKLQKIVLASGSGVSSRKLDSTFSSDLSVSEEAPPAKRPCTLTSATTQGNCLECEVKNAEINILRRRMQQLQEDLDLAVSSNGNKPNSSPILEEKYTTHVNKTGIRPIPETIYISDSQQHISTTTQQQQQQQQQLFQQQQPSLQQHLPQQHLPQQQLPQQQPRPLLPNPKVPSIVSSDTRQQSQSASTSSVKPSIEYVELIPGSDVYISSHKLEESTRDAKTGTQLARKLMDAFWDKDTLARSTLTPRSKFQYQQLDPKVIKAIEAYCLSYDSSLHSKDIHATMTDKCCQARSRYRTVTTSQLLYNPE